MDLEYIVFSLQNTAAQTPCLKIPEVSPLGNFSYSRFSKWPPKGIVEIIFFLLFGIEICIIQLFFTELTTRNTFPPLFFLI